jgi:hypothetical protein
MAKQQVSDTKQVTITLSQVQYDAIEDSNQNQTVEEVIQRFISNWADGYVQNIMNEISKADVEVLVKAKIAEKKAARIIVEEPIAEEN